MKDRFNAYSEVMYVDASEIKELTTPTHLSRIRREIARADVGKQATRA